MKKDGLYEKYVWEVPVRVTHWVNFLAIIILSVTGIFIGTAKTVAQEPSQFVMGWVRFVHFTAAYAFSVSVLSRIYWMFMGNRYASWREFSPFLSATGRHNMLETLKYYTFIGKKAPHPVGHNALAGTAYSAVILLYLVMDVGGFRAWSIIVRPAGANPLIAYFLHPIVTELASLGGLSKTLLAYKGSHDASIVVAGSLAMALFVCAVTGLLARLGLRVRL